MAPSLHHPVKRRVDIPDCVFHSHGILQEFAEKIFVQQEALKYFLIIYDVNTFSASYLNTQG
jgi:hypothetical protein